MLGALSPALAVLVQVILIDIVLAGDNAVIIAMVAADVPVKRRRTVIFWGLLAAIVIRIGLAIFATHILLVPGLMLGAGTLLLWVAARLWRGFHTKPSAKLPTDADNRAARVTAFGHSDMRRAIAGVVFADISMSLDNVLAVAGAAMNHIWVLALGLVLSIALMGFAATMIARLLGRYPWIKYAGFFILIYVACRMIWQGGLDQVFGNL